MEHLDRARKALDQCQVLTSEAEIALDGALAQLTIPTVLRGNAPSMQTLQAQAKVKPSWGSVCSSSASTPSLTPLHRSLSPPVPQAPSELKGTHDGRRKANSRSAASSSSKLADGTDQRGIDWLPATTVEDGSCAPNSDENVQNRPAMLHLMGWLPEKCDKSNATEGKLDGQGTTYKEQQLMARVGELEKEISRLTALYEIQGQMHGNSPPQVEQKRAQVTDTCGKMILCDTALTGSAIQVQSAYT